MNETLVLAMLCAVGVVLGAFFFGGLWWTVGKGVSSRQPALWFIASLGVRTIVVLPGFHFASGGHGDRLLSCLLGFVIASLVVSRLTKSQGEVKHASYP